MINLAVKNGNLYIARITNMEFINWANCSVKKTDVF